MRTPAGRNRQLAAFLFVIACLLCGCNCSYVIRTRVLEGPTSAFEVVALGSTPTEGQPVEGAGVRFWPGDLASDEQVRFPTRLTGPDGTTSPAPLVVKSLNPLSCGGEQTVSFECLRPGYQRVEGTFTARSDSGQVVVIHMAPAAEAAGAVPLGPAALVRLRPGAGYIYRVVVDKGYRRPAGKPAERGTDTHYVRVLVTGIEAAGDAVGVKGRLDELDATGKLMHGDLYRFAVGANADGSGAALILAASAPEGNIRGLAGGIPCFLLGYPNFGSVPKHKAVPPIVRNHLAGAMVARFTPTYDADTGKLEVSLERFRYAYEDEVARGRQVLYWVRDAQQLSPTAPAGQEVAPMYVRGVGFPRDKYGDPERYNVHAVLANEWETQVWEPGAPFPKEIRVSSPEAGGGYVARLVAVRSIVPGAAPVADDTEKRVAGSGEGRGWRDAEG